MSRLGFIEPDENSGERHVAARNGAELRGRTDADDRGVLRPVVGRVFDFDQAVEAVQSIGKGGIRGKAVITRA